MSVDANPMIYLPPKVIIEKYLRPHGLPESLIHEIPYPRYQGPGERNPGFEKSVVEQFVEERRPRSLDEKFYGEEEGRMAEIVEGLDRLVAFGREVFEALKPRLLAEAASTAIQDPSLAMHTTKEAAEAMGLHEQTVMRWCRQRKLGVKAGSRWLISQREIEQYLRGRLLVDGKQPRDVA